MSVGRLVRMLCAVTCTAIVLIANPTWAQTPVVQWTFDEPAGGTIDAIDVGAAPATNGMFGATATRTTDTPGGKEGFAVDLTAAGTTSIVDGGNPIEIDTPAQLTFTTWVKVTGATHYNEGGSVNVRLLAKQSSSALFDGYSWNMNAPATTTGSNNAFRTGLFVGGETNFDFGQSTADILDRGGDWLFMAVTYDGNSTENNMRFYIGDETSAVTQLGDPVSVNAGPVFPSNTSNGGMADARYGIGFTDAAPTADTSVTGYQDDVRAYDVILDLAALDLVRLENLPSGGGLEGDFNADGTVDAADYVVWRRDDGGQPGYDTWRGNFGAGSGSGATGGAAVGVPEPATWTLFILAAAAVRATMRRVR